MPRGSGPLLPQRWQPVPGCREALIYPLTRKVDTVIVQLVPCSRHRTRSSSSTPAAFRNRRHRLASIVLESPRSVGRAARRDPDPCPRRPLRGRALRPAAGRPGDGGDRGPGERGRRARVRRSPADAGGGARPRGRARCGSICTSSPRGGDGSGAPVTHTYANGAAVTVVRRPPESGLRHERLVIGTGPSLEVYHTPGHSPDSCCIRIGRLLFTGDLLFGCKSGHRRHLRMEPGGADPLPRPGPGAPLPRRYRGDLPRTRTDALRRRGGAHARRRREGRATPHGHRGMEPGPSQADRRICRGVHGAGERALHGDDRAGSTTSPT